MPANNRLVSTEWLAERLGSPGIAIVDGSWHMPATGRRGHTEFLEAHVPGAVFFDLDAIADTSSGLPHMLPSEEQFAKAVGAMGIGDDKTIVVYDAAGLFSAPRVWWTFRAFGARDVVILDGGFPKWKAEGRPTEAGEAKPTSAIFHAKLDRSVVAGIEDVAQASTSGSAQILDARAGERFRGEVPEPRAGLRSGHIPGARNLPITEVVKEGRLADAETLRSAVAASGIDPDKPVITSCGSGVTAAILWLALDTLGTPPKALYDGSWTEWGGSGKPVATGPAD
jgi:thiosulfate/3-mercaptopyruvate sulfurtransferase